MKIKSIILIICAIFTCAVQARSEQESFLRGNLLYEQQEYQQALDLYESIDSKGPAVWYNMGNCYYHLKLYAQALLCWKRAEKQAGWHELDAIWHNYTLLAKQLGYSVQDNWNTQCDRGVTKMFAIVPRGVAQVGSLLWVLMALISMIMLYQRRRWWLLSIFVILTIVFVGIALLSYRSEQRAVVTKFPAVVYAGPHTEYSVVGAANGATEVTLLYGENGWYKIQQDGLVGWISDNDLQHI